VRVLILHRWQVFLPELLDLRRSAPLLNGEHDSFPKMVGAGSFSTAVREMQVSQALVTKQMQELESWLGAQLLNHKSRCVSLTEVGTAFPERAARIFEAVEEAKGCGRRAADCACGHLVQRHGRVEPDQGHLPGLCVEQARRRMGRIAFENEVTLKSRLFALIPAINIHAGKRP
jgi:hypothetical protein